MKMKPHVSTAEGKALEAIRSAGLRGQWEEMAASYRFGFNWLPEDVRTPLLDRERELLAAGNRVRLAEFRALNSPDLLLERRCLAKAEGMQVRWAHEPTAAEAAANAAADRVRASKEQLIAERTQQILAGESVKREAAARALAVKQLKETES
jgi:hypothetical protein